MKRIKFLVAIAALQILVGSLTILGAAQPVRTSQDVVVPDGTYYHFEFGILGTGRLTGNLSELQGRSFDVYVFDDAGYVSFRDGSNTAAPLFEQSGTSIVFEMNLAGSKEYHVVAVDSPTRLLLQVHVDLVVVGLKTEGTLLAIIVLVGGLALLAASLMLSVWAWRRAPPAPAPSPDPAPDPPSDPQPDPAFDPAPHEAAPDPPDDNTRIY